MRILVTGANGYLGQGIVKSLLDAGQHVVATGFSLDKVDDRAEKVETDLFQITDPYILFGKPDILLHLSWRDGFVHYSDAHIIDIPKHYSFIKQMAEAGIKHIAVIGSMHEIGFYEGSINGNTPCQPITPYGIAKNSLRDLTRIVCQQQGVIFQWLRAYYIVGNSKSGCSIFSKIAIAEEEGKKEFPFTTGQNQYDFMDYIDFCNAISKAVTQTDVTGIIEICCGRPEKLANRVERFILENKYSIQLKYGAFPDRPYDSKAIWGNSEKLDEIIGKSKK